MQSGGGYEPPQSGGGWVQLGGGYESPQPEPWRLDEPADYVERMLKQIVAFRIPIDRLEGKGFARRVPDPADRRRVKVEVTKAFYSRAGKIWGPVAADRASSLERFSGEQLESFHRFLRTTNEITRRHLARLRERD